MEVSPGRCLIPWQIFSALPVVRAIAPNAAALASLRQHLLVAGAIGPQRMVDIVQAEGVVVRLQRAAKPAQPKRQSAKPAGMATSRQRLAGGYTSPDMRLADWS